MNTDREARQGECNAEWNGESEALHQISYNICKHLEKQH